VPRKDLIYPYGGRYDSAPLSQQPELYTVAARSVRGRDPVTGRMRGGQRAGLRKFNASVIGASRIKALCSTAIDDRKIVYTFDAGTPTLLWDVETTTRVDSRAGRTDRQGNLYALSGPASVAKFNSSGRALFTIPLPVAEQANEVRALWVDDADRIFAAVSQGGDPLLAKMFCYQQTADNGYELLWEFVPGAFTEELQVYRGSSLFAAHNYPTENRSRVVEYGELGLIPVERRRIESVAFPINGMHIGDDGSIYTASQPLSASPTDFTTLVDPDAPRIQNFRLGHPSARPFAPSVVGWTPFDLDDWKTRIWSWYDATEIDETDVEGGVLKNAVQILRWRDKSGNGRDMFAGSIINTDLKGPLYKPVGVGGLPCVQFINENYVTDTDALQQVLVSLPNDGSNVAVADQQRTALPAYDGSMFAVFIVVRQPAVYQFNTDSATVILQNGYGGSGPEAAIQVQINQACGDNPESNATEVAGDAFVFMRGDAGDPGQCAVSPTRHVPLSYNADAKDEGTGCVLISFLHDGGIEPGNTTKTRSLVRFNGEPIDRFEGDPFAASGPLSRTMFGNSLVTSAGTNTHGMNGELCEIIVIDRRDRTSLTEPKVLTHDHLETGDPGAAQTDNEMARIEAYLAWKWGIGHILSRNTDTFPHFYGLDASNVGGPPKPIEGGASVAHEEILQAVGLTAKHDSRGNLQWVCNEHTHPDTGTNKGGIGYGVVSRKVESDGLVHVWMTGPFSDAGGGERAVRKVIDLSETFSGASADGAWRFKFDHSIEQDYPWPRMAADKFGNLFVPAYGLAVGGLGVDNPDLYGLAKDPGGSGNATELFEYETGVKPEGFAAVIPPDALMPEYRTQLATPLSEHVYLLHVSNPVTIAASASIFKVRLVTSTAAATGSPRTVHTIAVVEDDIRLIASASNSIPSGGSGVLDAASQYVQAFRAGEHIIVLDGINYFAYDLRTGLVAPLESKSAGEIPPRAKIGMYWRHRLMFLGFADHPSNYVASKLGDIFNYDLFPAVTTSTQAFSGTLTRAGEAADVIVAAIPVWDDLAFILGESRILRLTGDPQDGGNIHLVTDSMGGVFGDSWCKDQSGRVFMFGNSPPGLYMLLPEGDPVPLSRHTLEESEMADIDFGTHRIVLAWNPIQRGVHIWRVAWSTSTVVDHWFWEEKTHQLVKNPPIWTDRYGLAGLQPTAYTYLGGDDTRGLLLGCEDGYVRFDDPEAVSDDGTLIDSFVVIGPLTPAGGPERDYRLIDVEIALADDQGGARLEVLASETADSLGTVQWARDLKPGMNAFRVRVKAPHIYLRLRGVGLKRWAFESGRCTIVATSKTQESAEIG